MFFRSSIAALSILCVPAIAIAHHSGAAYDMTPLAIPRARGVSWRSSVLPRHDNL